MQEVSLQIILAHVKCHPYDTVGNKTVATCNKCQAMQGQAAQHWTAWQDNLCQTLMDKHLAFTGKHKTLFKLRRQPELHATDDWSLACILIVPHHTVTGAGRHSTNVCMPAKHA
jgi:hypothetical protein